MRRRDSYISEGKKKNESTLCIGGNGKEIFPVRRKGNALYILTERRSMHSYLRRSTPIDERSLYCDGGSTQKSITLLEGTW